MTKNVYKYRTTMTYVCMLFSLNFMYLQAFFKEVAFYEHTIL